VGNKHPRLRSNFVPTPIVIGASALRWTGIKQAFQATKSRFLALVGR